MPILAIVAIASVGTYSLVASHANSLRSAVRFSGTITQDECATSRLPIGDVGCNMTVGGRVVYVAHGNIRQTKPWGRTIGFSSLKTNYTGKKVEVYAAVTTTPNLAYTLEGSTRYYVRLLPNQSPPIVPGYIAGSIYLRATNGNCPSVTPCASSNVIRTFQAMVAVRTASGALVTNITSSSTGSFSVTLPAGTYVLVPQIFNNVRAESQTVKVSQAVTTKVTITYSPTAPTPTPNPPAPNPAPLPIVKHPTPADCKATPKMTVYASVPSGTPAYTYASANQPNKTVLYSVPFQTAITDVYCNDAGTWLYHSDGNNVISTYSPQDVSLTKP